MAIATPPTKQSLAPTPPPATPSPPSLKRSWWQRRGTFQKILIVVGAIILALIVIGSLTNKSGQPQAASTAATQPATAAPSATASKPATAIVPSKPAASKPAATAPASAARSGTAVGQAMRNGAGQTVTVSSFTLNVPIANEFEQPSAGNQCVSVNLALVNGDSSPWSLPLYEMAIVDANGQTHSQAIGTCGGGGSSIDSLVPKGRASSTLLFEAPTAGALTFMWTPSALNPNSNYQTPLK